MKKAKESQKDKRLRRATRVRARLLRTSSRPRLSVHKSNSFVYLQLIDDEQGKTVLSASTRGLSGTPQEKIIVVAKNMAKEMIQNKITACVFDRGHNKYHGIVENIAKEIRSAGIIM